MPAMPELLWFQSEALRDKQGKSRRSGKSCPRVRAIPC